MATEHGSSRVRPPRRLLPWWATRWVADHSGTAFARSPCPAVRRCGSALRPPRQPDPSTFPTNIKQAGWWDGGSKLGDPFGAIVVAAHVDSFTQGLGRFAELLSMKPGDLIRLDSAHLSDTYQVVRAGLVPEVVDLGQVG